MGEIYSNCHKVIIWTGGDIQGLQLAVDTYTPLGRHLFDSPDNWPEDVELHALDDRPVDVEPVWQLLLRPWFRRSWVVQEAVLPNTAVVVAGSCQLTIEDLYWATSWCETLVRRRNIEVGVDRLTAPDFYAPKAALAAIFSLRQRSPARRHSLRTQYHGFDSLIMDSLAANHASDPRDHVYAFLGFQKDSDISIVADYSLSAPEVFTRAARAVIQGMNSLELLRFLPNSPPTSQIVDDDRAKLPSWVPDWSARRTEGRIFRSPFTLKWDPWPTSHFDAARGIPHRPNPLILGHESELVVSGRIIDSLAAILSSVDDLAFDRKDRPRFFTLTDEEVTALDATALSDPAQRLRKRLVVVLTGGCLTNAVKPPPPAIGLGVEEVLKSCDGQGPPVNVDDPMFVFGLHHRRLRLYTPVRTGRNKLALVRDTARVGDSVAILHGFQVPMVLRPKERGTYVVVGQCYLEDAMFGEAMTWEEDEADKFTLV